jgi:cysteine desulfurase
VKARSAKVATPVYLDYQATTPVDDRVLAAMLPFFATKFGNASSVDHRYGSDAHDAVEDSRGKLARLIGGQPQDIVFTSGATEANNLAILGIAEAQGGSGGHVITAASEHHAVLDPCEYLARKGWRVTVLPVDREGCVDPDDVRRALAVDTQLVSIMAANNEIGTLAPVHEIGRITAEAGVIFHCDAAQAVGYIDVDVEAWNVDLLTLSAHKFYGPKGIGALYVRGRGPRRRLRPLQYGGGHERGLRSGTLNVPGIVGLGAASEIAAVEAVETRDRLKGLRDRLWEQLATALPSAEINGHPTARLPHNLNVYLPEVNARALVVQVKNELAISTGAACSSAKAEPSHVITALRISDDRARSSFRISVGRATTGEAVDFAAAVISDCANLLR